MGKLLSTVMETCPSCDTRTYHEIRRVDTEDHSVELNCVSCGRPIIVSYQAIPRSIERLIERLPKLRGSI